VTAFTADVPGNIKGGLLAANVPMTKPGWAFSGWVWTWLYNLKTSTGAYIYRDEMNRGQLLGDPFVVCNQISTSNSGAPTTSDYGDIFYGDWSEFIDFVQVDMELMASKEASYVNSDGNTISAMQNDMTVLRALCLHDFGVRHLAAFIKGTYKYSTT
jgi:HK97 family phage major capsid protein